MIGFLGEFEVTLDAKGRFLLPAGFKKQLTGENASQFVITKSTETCLDLYPLETWDPIFSDISKLKPFDPKASDFKRYFLNGASKVELDSAGRLLISKNLMEHAGLGKDIVLAASVDKIEIWDISKYKEFFESFSRESFKQLADEVMNKKVDG